MTELEEIQIETADRRRCWAVVLGAKPSIDGNKWCVLWGDNIQDGVAGFGDTPEKAIWNFEDAIYKKVCPDPITKETK